MEKKLSIFIFFLIASFFPTVASAATMSVSPASGTYEVGDRLNIQVMVSSNQDVNAISGTLSFPPIFSVESVSKSSSILNFWVAEPSASRVAGTVSFEGVALGGFSGGTGNVVTVSLVATREGTGSVVFNSGQVLANDGQGTNLTSGFGGSSFIVKAKTNVAPASAPVVAPTPTTAAPSTKPTTTKKPEVKAEPKEDPVPVAETQAQQPPTLRSPEIMLSKKFGEDAVLGVSDYKNNQVLLTFVSKEGIKVFVQDKTDDEGSFLTLIPQTLKRGTYEISAVVIKEDFSYTTQSNTIQLHVGNMFSDISPELKVLIATIIAITVFLLIRIIFFILRRNAVRRNVKKESNEALDIVKKSFKILRKEISKARTKSGGEEVQEDLEDAEKIIAKEIKDISKKL